MPRNDEQKVRRHIHLYKRDVERIEQIFGGRDNIGFSKAVRAMVRSALNQMEAKSEARHRAVHIDQELIEKMVAEEIQE